MADNTTNPAAVDNGVNSAAAQQPATSNAATTTTSPTQTMTPEAIAEAFAKALTARTDRAERSVARSFAEQYGMTETEVTALLEKAKADKASAIPPEVQKQIDDARKSANELLIAAEVKSIGAEMGLLDAETAMMIMDRANVTVAENGAVTGVKESLEALKTSKGFLFGQHTAGAWGQKQSGTAARMTKEEIAKITDPAKLRAAIAENLDLFK